MSVAVTTESPSGPHLDEAIRRELAERRLSALAHAVREHEDRVHRQVGGVRPHDALLHHRLRQILGS